MAHKRDYSQLIHISPVNKKLLEIECRKRLIENNDEFSKDDKIPANRILSTLIKNYLGVSYFSLKSEYENESHERNTRNK